MSFKSWNSYWAFSHIVRHRSRYIHSADVKDFLSNVLITSKERVRVIEAGSVFWRSQLGNDRRPVFQDGEEIAEEPAPFSRERMKPVQYAASEGRANPKGIPYLYLATDKETAMSEVRPWLGSNISVGQFNTVKELRLIDCSVNHAKGGFFYFKEPSEKEKDFAVWAHIDRAFSEPVTLSDKSSDYVPTQIIAELFKSEGFDGVVYKSALSDGFNLVLFDINAANIVNCSLYEAKEIKFSFSESANPYFIRSDENK